jgi:hypothetical protein
MESRRWVVRKHVLAPETRKETGYSDYDERFTTEAAAKAFLAAKQAKFIATLEEALELGEAESSLQLEGRRFEVVEVDPLSEGGGRPVMPEYDQSDWE